MAAPNDRSVSSPPSSGLTKLELAESRIYPGVNTPAKAAVILHKARFLDLDPSFVAENIAFINGKPAGTGLLLAALLKRSGKYRYLVTEKTARVCRIQFLERLDGKWEVIGIEAFTLEMAQRAKLTSNPSWSRFPEQMLFWRCLVAGARTHCPDALAGGCAHLIEEVRPEVPYDEEGRPTTTGVIIDAEVILPQAEAETAK